jgi:hypothetical protein
VISSTCVCNVRHCIIVIKHRFIDNIHVDIGAPDKLRICAMKTSKNACIIRSECTHYTYILLCKQTFQIRSILVQSCTLTIHFCLWEIPRNYFPLYFSKERAYTSQGNRQTSGESASLPTESAKVATSASQGYRKLAFLSIDVKRDLIGCLW